MAGRALTQANAIIQLAFAKARGMKIKPLVAARLTHPGKRSASAGSSMNSRGWRTRFAISSA
jgi:hypothetical protein